jgi:hypothetical protein
VELLRGQQKMELELVPAARSHARG